MIHSKFNPASMPSELLEHTFVQREKLAKRLTDVFTESALCKSKHHVLLVGPRGIGKSHLVALVYHRLKKRAKLKDKLVIAYLREEEWGINSFLDLLVRILRATGTDTTELTHLDPTKAEEQAWALLQKRIGRKTLLVILENLDSAFRNLGEEGQKKWRSLIQTYPFWALLTTTPALSTDISKQASPFYGFFEIQNLKGLSFSESVALLSQLALSQRDKNIAKYVSSPTGRAKVRAIQHLANGNHRIFVIFYDFLAEDRQKDDLLRPLLKTIDALTPYYQSQMKELSPQQRKLVEFLCEHHRPATVKTIASQCFISHQTAASQLKQLLEARYLRVTRIGREAYYELNEPLLRICVEAKSHSDEPVRLLVEFLRYWFSRQELQEKLAAVESNSSKQAYIAAALKEYDNAKCHEHLSSEVAQLCAALTLAGELDNQAAVKVATQELAEVSKIAEDWIHYTRALIYLDRPREALPLIRKKAQQTPKDPDVLWALAKAYAHDSQLEVALPILEKAIVLNPREKQIWLDKGRVLDKLGRYDDAIVAFSQAFRLPPKRDIEPILNKAGTLLRMERYGEAERLLKRLLEGGKSNRDVFIPYGFSLSRLGRTSEALTYFAKATKSAPHDWRAWFYKSQALHDLKRSREALADAERAMEIAPSNSDVQHSYCKTLFALGEYQRAMETLETEAVAHQVFHEMLDLTDARPEKIRNVLVRLRSSLAGKKWQEAILGGLIEFTSSLCEQASVSDVSSLRKWNDILSGLFKAQPRFAILLKMFDVMVRYKESSDKKVLLELPLEQRSLLEKSDTSHHHS